MDKRQLLNVLVPVSCIAQTSARECRYTKHGNRMIIIQMKPELACTYYTSYHNLDAYTSTCFSTALNSPHHMILHHSAHQPRFSCVDVVSADKMPSKVRVVLSESIRDGPLCIGSLNHGSRSETSVYG